jgi:hypothetical protein
MRTVISIVIGLVCTLAGTAVCAEGIDFSRLPELPERYAVTLKALHGERFLVSPQRVDAPAVAPAPLDRPNCETITKYFTQVTYPRTICVPEQRWMDVVSDDDPHEHVPARTDPPPIQLYRLTRMHGQPLKSGMVCILRSGPWTASLERQTLCNGVDEWVLEPFGGGSVFPAAFWAVGTDGPPAPLQTVQEPYKLCVHRTPCPGSISACDVHPSERCQ